MTPRSVGWSDLLRSLGRAFQDLLRSEVAALSDELAGSGRRLAAVAGLFLLAAFGLFWALGLLTFAAVEAAAMWLPRWAAALSVFGAVLLVAAILAAVAWRRFRRLETPAATIRRRVAEHVDWWETRILADETETPPEAPLADFEEKR